ncbi:BZ3500_MvSof-1268-A1-R1_Chr4-3g07272 [Microbotryum saponariae]|uniref:BZ3500_MvSof-1268-A1-R1_Chr4-3g07272 protein n=1 Tax=Microbotryum saponariae TaxID=289078 RepID=A0A2X0MCI0_9BASI|nr:BZ3500_MvSof-1268-A1-R1_Chr4-3g07272 [Microbotryum saponariae]SDA06935.1 BZ3501_MvSof-1269-A2-R1_Chr4-2g06981 [Microbotryum saponariae]
MVLEAVSHLVREVVDPNKAILAILASIVVFGLRNWARGFINEAERDLHGKTYLLVVRYASPTLIFTSWRRAQKTRGQGCFSGPGLSLLQALAARGAQIVALHPDPMDAEVTQLILLLRSAARNERIYADQCDMLSIASVQRFAAQWSKNGKSGMVQDLEAKIDGVVFSDGLGSGLSAAPTSQEIHQVQVRSRLAMIQFLLPVLLKSSRNSTSGVRIVSQVSPLYSAALDHSTTLSLNCILPDERASAPATDNVFYGSSWRTQGRSALAAILLVQELHTRFATRNPNLLFISVCPGFTRSFLHASIGNIRRGGWPLRLLAYPFIWVFAKSASEASQILLTALLADVRKPEVIDPAAPPDEGAVCRATKSEIPPVVILRGGTLVREGREVRIMGLDSRNLLGSNLWAHENLAIDAELKLAAERKKPVGREGAEGDPHPGAGRAKSE